MARVTRPRPGRSPASGAACPSAALAILGAVFLLLGLPAGRAAAQPFRLPTGNDALLRPGEETRFFAPTPGRTWTSGQFGCVRSDGTQMHEGIDILAVARDRRGEPTDEVHAAAGGTVAYVNRKAGLSNYGIYVVLRHPIEGLDVLTLYAHLREARSDLRPGTAVAAGERLGVMGRTTNTRTPIARDRAHLHFEIDLLANEDFSAWLRQREPKTRDDHGAWNGRNLLGIDPAEVFRRQQELGPRFSLLTHLRTRTELCRVFVADTSFPWLRRYPLLIRRNGVAEREGIAGYEMALDYNGLPFQLVPRARSEIALSPSPRLLSVNGDEYRRHPCRQLVVKRGQVWTLTARGTQLIDLLTH